MIMSLLPQLLNVALMFAFLVFVLRKPARNFFAKRRERVASALENSAKEAEKANELKVFYEQKLQDIEAERKSILSEARTQANETEKRVLAEAEVEAAAISQKAKDSSLLEWERAQDEMKAAIINISSAMSAKFIKQTIDKQTAWQFFSETVAGLGKLSWKD